MRDDLLPQGIVWLVAREVRQVCKAFLSPVPVGGGELENLQSRALIGLGGAMNYLGSACNMSVDAILLDLVKIVGRVEVLRCITSCQVFAPSKPRGTHGAWRGTLKNPADAIRHPQAQPNPPEGWRLEGGNM